MSGGWVAQWVGEDRERTLKRMESRSTARSAESGILFLFACSGIHTDFLDFPWNDRGLRRSRHGPSAVIVSISSHTHG